MIGRAEDDDAPAAPPALPEQSIEHLPGSALEALVERLLPAYRLLLHSGDEHAQQGEGHGAHSTGS